MSINSRLKISKVSPFFPPFFPIFRERIELTGDYIPVLVSFEDINDPMSIRRVFPGKLADVFGEGYSLKSVWVEKTDDDYVEPGLQKKLAWVGSRSEDGTWAYVHPFRKAGLHGVVRPLKRNM